MPRFSCILLLAFLTLFSSNLHTRVIHVPGDSPTIRGGINMAVDRDTVMVHPGSYHEYDLDFQDKAIIVMSTDPEDSATVASTIVDGDLRGGVFIFQSGEDAASVLAGLTVTRGYAPYGGGMYCVNSSPTVINCTFSQSVADYYGGGLYIKYSNVTVTNCLFSQNTSQGHGGGMYNRESSPVVDNCTFNQNSAQDGGGGMWNYLELDSHNQVTIMNCTFSENSAYSGGGMYNYREYERSPTSSGGMFDSNSAGWGGGLSRELTGYPAVINCTFSGNSAGNGGGMFNAHISPTITNCTFSRNEVEYNGGGMNNEFNSSPTITNCIFSQNETDYYGGGIRNYMDSSPTVTNCTFSQNRADDGGGIYNRYSSSPIVTNSIFWGDTGGEIYVYSSTPTVTYSNVQGSYPGEGNIDTVPLFRDTINEDMHLMAITCGDSDDSPCIDAGDPAIADTILDCAHGLGTSRSDMGAYGGQGEGPPLSIGKEKGYLKVRTVPKAFRLSQNFPNPFNPSTTISFDIPGTFLIEQPVNLNIYDLRGRRIRTLLDSVLEPGSHKINWDGRDDRGKPVGSGIYLYTLRVGEERFTRKMLLLK